MTGPAIRSKGALSIVCPKCLAPTGHRCRVLKLRGDQPLGATKTTPHLERIEAAKWTR